jgi:hypothetical protein
MRLSRAPFSIRSIIVVVAVLSLVLWAKGTLERRIYYQRRAAYWAGREHVALKMAVDLEGERSESLRAWSIVERDTAAKYGRRRLKYESGAAHPWSLVVPDPEELRGRIWPGVGFVAEGLEGEQYPAERMNYAWTPHFR